MNKFRDPIHGFIEVTDEEKRIIDSGPFRRLRNIKQLATTNLVYHGAEHTRFGHSLGVMHLVTQTFDAVMQKNPNLFSKKANENDKICLYYRQILRLIALCHDLGHAPFSHASEELFSDRRTHEDYTKDIICNTEIADYIEDIGKEFQKKYGNEYSITPDLIWMIYGGEVMADGYKRPDYPFLQNFVDGELDCDKMDYLLRDSYYCGVNYGKYDLERFISTLTVYKTKNSMKLAIETGGIQALEEFILARYFMFIQVYFHKTRRYFDKQLVEALKRILPDGHYPAKTKEYLKWDDNRVMYELQNCNSQKVRPFMDRITMTCVYETPAHTSVSESQKFQMIYNLLCKELGARYIMIDSVDKVAHKLHPFYFSSSGEDDDSGKTITILGRDASEKIDLMEESKILNSIIAPIYIRRIYVKKEKVQIAKNLIKKVCLGGKANGRTR